MNEKLATVDIKGKDYVLVNERIRAFRETYKGYRLVSEILSNESGVCIVKASIYDENGNTIATGHAYEKEGSSFINKTSYIENCETSAWGRALGNLGIGIDTSIASYEEVANAVNQQKKTPTKEGQQAVKNAQNDMDKMFASDKQPENADIDYTKIIMELCFEKGIESQTITKHYKVENIDDLTRDQKIQAIAKLRKTEARDPLK